MYLSSNFGIDWVQKNEGLTNQKVASLYVYNNYIFAGTDPAYVWKRLLSDIVSTEIEQKNIPQSPSLSQNYPNPFNPVTRIKFSLPNPSKGGAWKNVRLIVYDILGREIATLIPPLGGGQEGLKPGSYEVTWDGSRYASGVYFYKLVTDECD